MITHSKVAQFVRALSAQTNSKNLWTNYVLLGEVIRTDFPPPSPLWVEYEALGKQIKKGQTSEKTAKSINDFNNLVGAVSKYLNEFAPQLPTSVSDRNQEEIAQLVDRAFHQSRLFTATKWILAVSLSLLGLGSLGYVGVNVLVIERIQAAQDKAAAATKELTALAADINNKRTEIEQSAKKALSDVQNVINTETGVVKKVFDTAIKQTEVDLAANMKKASDEIEQQQEAAALLLKSQIKDSAGKFDTAVANQVGVVTKSANDGSQRIADEVQAGLRPIDKAAEDGRAKVADRADQAAKQTMDALDAALNQKLPALDQKSHDTEKRLEAIASKSEAAEKQFESDLEKHIASWNHQIDDAIKRNDEISQAVDSLEQKTKDLGTKLQAFQNSSVAALEVAEQLRTGTKTGELPLIGRVLEKSAVLFVASLTLAGGGALIAIFSLLVAFLRTSVQARPQPPNTPL